MLRNDGLIQGLGRLDTVMLNCPEVSSIEGLGDRRIIRPLQRIAPPVSRQCTGSSEDAPYCLLRDYPLPTLANSTPPDICWPIARISKIGAMRRISANIYGTTVMALPLNITLVSSGCAGKLKAGQLAATYRLLSLPVVAGNIFIIDEETPGRPYASLRGSRPWTVAAATPQGTAFLSSVRANAPPHSPDRHS